MASRYLISSYARWTLLKICRPSLQPSLGPLSMRLPFGCQPTRLQFSTAPPNVKSQILKDLSHLDQRIVSQEDTPYRDALDILHRLSKLQTAGSKRQPFPTDVMAALLDLVRSLADQGRITDALRYIETCIEVQSRYSVTEASEGWLADALSLRSLLSQHDHNNVDALKYAQEAAKVCQKLVVDHGSSYNSYLAAALMNLGCRYHEMDETDHAISALKRAILLARQQQPLQSPPEQSRTLGEALTQLSFMQLRAAPEEALRNALEALGLARAAVATNDGGSSSFSPTLAEAVTHCVRVLLSLQRGDEVGEYVHELKSLCADLAPADVQREELLENLTEAAKVLLEHREFEHALAIAMAVKESQPEGRDKWVAAEIAFTLAACYSELGALDSAKIHIQECILQHEVEGASRLQELASAHSEHSRILLMAQDIAGSTAACVNAVQVQRRVVVGSEDADQHVNLGMFLVEVSRCRLALQQWDAALEATEEAIQICQNNLRVPVAHTCLAGAYLGKMKAYVGLQDHTNVIDTADKLQLILQTSLEEDGYSPSTFASLIESVEMMIPSLKELDKEEELLEAKEMLEALRGLEAQALSGS
ncbi:hypothetical protein FRB93_002739 [Tulasnella sp. JGI-2019a]|nr:hypothetical protein FRB93_002739 [Tulasnella sp. JGI-2019a]